MCITCVPFFAIINVLVWVQEPSGKNKDKPYEEEFKVEYDVLYVIYEQYLECSTDFLF